MASDINTAAESASIQKKERNPVYVSCPWLREGLTWISRDAKAVDAKDAPLKTTLPEDKIQSIGLGIQRESRREAKGIVVENARNPPGKEKDALASCQGIEENKCCPQEGVKIVDVKAVMTMTNQILHLLVFQGADQGKARA